ncbi:zinc-binding dehydrogenase [Actinosynnema sp. NPDC047251]|uniref:Putative quinone oxidoreductase n=1 Tax=Saccharothrix espanaensis (strain ATCC 51144 / DSM 44229 / JCM 9112 / NBRC 15066 / NRRL 15764) TaxID=1179773 RepID=K0JUH6_SACES|nr:zinc-binding dehydrogenase [Saccharothrix espanaensis]CCH28459.1 putative quinone oxidoreductase [Saccharothrix espanaensis DSM 44229]
MHAVLLRGFGSPAELRYEETADPVPGPGQARIAVRAAGVHLVDAAIRAGRADWLPLPELPAVPGSEVAGVVDAVGAGVPDSWLGQRVVAQLGLAHGGYAELAVREVGALHVVPEGLGFAEAVAMICTGGTAVGVLAAAALGPDDVVVVTAAAGAVGHLLVQGASRAGAHVVGLAGCGEKRRTVLRCGAAVAVDYRQQGWVERVCAELGGREVTAVLDGVGGGLGRGAVDLLAPGGRVVMFGSSSGAPTEVTTADLFDRALSATVGVGPHVVKRAGGLRALESRALADAAAGRFTPVVRSYGLACAARAHEELESRHTVGKVVLVPAG